MKQKRHTTDQIISKLRQAAFMECVEEPVPETDPLFCKRPQPISEPDPRCDPAVIAKCKEGCRDRAALAAGACAAFFEATGQRWMLSGCGSAAAAAGIACDALCDAGCP